MIQLPIEAFCINGKHGDKISLTIDGVYDFPKRTSSEGGYNFIGTLEIKADCYTVKSSQCISATGTLYRFCDELKKCREGAADAAEYKTMLEANLFFTVKMYKGGRAHITGEFCDKPEKKTKLIFDIDADQNAFWNVTQSIDGLKKHFGGMEGIVNG